MIDLHMHTLNSDGELIPAELARRAVAIGCRAIAMTDHVDISNVEFVTEALVRFAEEKDHGLRVLPGVEITHVRPNQMSKVAELARKGGAKVIVVHGQTIVEPVEEGTNEAAIDCGADILAHPGLITLEFAKKAASSGLALEISGRGGHYYCNGHVAKVGIEAGAQLIFNTDTHAPRDLMNRDMALAVIRGAGVDMKRAEGIIAYAEKLVEDKSGSLRQD